MRASRRTTGFYCKGHPLLFSPSRRLAYLKTPKAASLAIQDHFQRTFQDYRWVDAHESLPNGTIVFTFVRDPVKRLMSAYGEIDIAYAMRAPPEVRSIMRTTFDKIKRQVPGDASGGGAPRLLAFLDDLVDHRFGGDDRAHWMPTHAYPQLNFLCMQRVDFIGRLETQDADWHALQALAHIPTFERTGFPRGHSSTNKTRAPGVSVIDSVHNPNATAITCRACSLKLADEKLPASPQVLPRICSLFASDFFCLGYALPSECQNISNEVSTKVGSAAFIPLAALPLPGQGVQAAPVYVLPYLNASAVEQLLVTPDYQNTLFVLGCAAENRSTLYRLRRAANESFSFEQSHAAAVLRKYDRYGWHWRNSSSTSLLPRAPLAIGIPVTGAGAREDVERSLAEAQQLLLLHRYDRVIIVGHELLRGSVKDDRAGSYGRLSVEQISRWLVDPLTQAREQAVRTHAPTPASRHHNGTTLSNNHDGSARTTTSKASGPSPPHKHFLPGRQS